MLHFSMCVTIIKFHTSLKLILEKSVDPKSIQHKSEKKSRNEQKEWKQKNHWNGVDKDATFFHVYHKQ